MQSSDLFNKPLNKIIRLQEVVTRNDENNKAVQMYEDWLQTKAFIKPLTGYTWRRYEGDNSYISYVFYIRYMAEMKYNITILYKQRRFFIKSVVNVEEKNKYYRIIAEARLWNNKIIR